MELLHTTRVNHIAVLCRYTKDSFNNIYMYTSIQSFLRWRVGRFIFIPWMRSKTLKAKHWEIFIKRDKNNQTNKHQHKNKQTNERTKQQKYPYISSKLLQDAYRLISFQDICLLKIKKQFRMKRKYHVTSAVKLTVFMSSLLHNDGYHLYTD